MIYIFPIAKKHSSIRKKINFSRPPQFKNHNTKSNRLWKALKAYTILNDAISPVAHCTFSAMHKIARVYFRRNSSWYGRLLLENKPQPKPSIFHCCAFWIGRNCGDFAPKTREPWEVFRSWFFFGVATMRWQHKRLWPFDRFLFVSFVI